MANISTAHARWEGDLPSGAGSATLASGAGGPMGIDWRARTEGAANTTTPEELIGAAHASCFSMALANILGDEDHAPDTLETEARVTFEQTEGGFRISEILLRVRGTVPGITADGFRAAAEKAKEDCPVSRALSGEIAISVEAELA